jgi:hypothetical protein
MTSRALVPLAAATATAIALALAACSSNGGGANGPAPPSDDAGADAGNDAAPDAPDDAPPAADWTLTYDPSSTAGPLPATLLGQYDLSGALFHYDQQAPLIPLMKAAGFSEWRVGLGRWEGLTQLLPTLTDGTSCAQTLAGLPKEAQAPGGTTDLDLIQARDWFTYTDGSPVTMAMTGDDTRYRLDYVRSVLDVADRFGAAPYFDVDLMPRALAANQTPTRTTAEWGDACGWTWTNEVSNVAAADPDVFAAAIAGMVRRLIEGSGGQPGRPLHYLEFWNEPELGYAWNPHVADFQTYLATAVKVLGALDAYRKQTANADGKAIKIGLGSFAVSATAATMLTAFPGPFDFVSFHLESSDDPLAMVASVQAVAAARKASSHPDAELLLTEWGYDISGSKLDPRTMDVALHHATLLALGAPYLTHAHHALFWDWYDVPDYPYAFIHHDFTPKPAYYVFTLLAKLIGGGASRLEAAGFSDGKLDGGMGAVLAGKGGDGVVRVLIVNRNATARTATVGAVPKSVTVFDDPAKPPRGVAPSQVVQVPPRSIVLVER